MSGIAGADRGAATAAITYRDLVGLDDYAAVVALEREIWGPDYDEALPPAILKVTLRRGGILVGAFDDDRLIGFVYSLPGNRHGIPTQWSHKLGVQSRCRNAGVGYHLKLLQRDRALRMGFNVIEWTFDPLQATNARLNVAKLGTIVEEYEEDFYGHSTVPLRYRNHPTDRFITVWNIRDARVELRVIALRAAEAAARDNFAPRHAALKDCATSVLSDAAPANRAIPAGEWTACHCVELHLTAPRLTIEIPTEFSDMQARAPERALAWRLATRQLFTHYFGRGYRVVEFVLDRAHRKGAYLLEKQRKHAA